MPQYDSTGRKVWVNLHNGEIAEIELEDFHVEPNVHSLAVDAETHRVYAPEEQEDGKPVARMVVYEAVP